MESTGSVEGAKEQEKRVTTETRKPLKVPESVHIRITPDNLKDYVGPPVYHKDRLYGFAPPPGVSSGLGYLGNGSGALMPIEATVSFYILLHLAHSILTNMDNFKEYAR